jgi:hypothetical protein
VPPTVNLPARDSDHKLPSNAQVKNARSPTSPPPYGVIALRRTALLLAFWAAPLYLDMHETPWLVGYLPDKHVREAAA